MTWILVLYIYAGAMASGDSVTVTSVPGFASRQQCEQAGNASRPLVDASSKELRFVCVSQGK